VDDPHLATRRSVIAADWVARIARTDMIHMECQGYRDTCFLNRLFKYHVHFVVRYPGYRVRTVALWLIEPPQGQRLEVIRRGSLRLSIRSLVLARLPAARMLKSPLLACFAAGAAPGEWTAEELCERVAAALRRRNATEQECEFALVASALRGRYTEMVKAMRSERLKPVVSIELLRYSEDVGYAKGRKRGTREGVQEGLRTALLSTFDARSVRLSGANKRRITEESSVVRLKRWVRRAATARKAAVVFAD
jgi:hypothetical protein